MTRRGTRHTDARKADPLRRPRPGSKLRAVYDALATGNVINVHKMYGHKCSGGYIDQLRNFYNCEIVGHHKVGSRMTGRWDGGIFVPVERLGHATDEEIEQ